jgi:hypothetical protein
MLGLFKPKLPVTRDEAEWLLACFAWMVREFGGMEQVRGTPLVLPTAEFFPPSELKGHERALELFGQVKALAGMSDWECDLLAGAEDRPAQVGTAQLLRHHSKQPAGTFGFDRGRYFITYNPATLAQPEAMVATFAHELAHYLIHGGTTRPPGGPELEEHATDAGSVFLGFGVFAANCAKSFSQFQDFEVQGWQMQSLGYLSELARVTALAIFVRLSGADARAAEGALKNYLRGPFRKAIAALDREHPDLEASLAGIELGDWA